MPGKARAKLGGKPGPKQYAITNYCKAIDTVDAMDTGMDSATEQALGLQDGTGMFCILCHLCSARTSASWRRPN